MRSAPGQIWRWNWMSRKEYLLLSIHHTCHGDAPIPYFLAMSLTSGEIKEQCFSIEIDDRWERIA